MIAIIVLPNHQTRVLKDYSSLNDTQAIVSFNRDYGDWDKKTNKHRVSLIGDIHLVESPTNPVDEESQANSLV